MIKKTNRSKATSIKNSFSMDTSPDIYIMKVDTIFYTTLLASGLSTPAAAFWRSNESHLITLPEQAKKGENDGGYCFGSFLPFINPKIKIEPPCLDGLLNKNSFNGSHLPLL